METEQSPEHKAVGYENNSQALEINIEEKA